MCHRLLYDATFYAALFDLDQELAQKARAQGCPECQGALHTADYPRKPRAPIELSAEQRWRKSLCCGSCRRRHTPQSVRFLGAKVYLSVVIALATALTQGISPSAQRKLREELQIDRRTLERWRKWWQDTFAASPFWKVARGSFATPPDDASLPRSLFESFAAQSRDGLLKLLSFIAPLSRAR